MRADEHIHDARSNLEKPVVRASRVRQLIARRIGSLSTRIRGSGLVRPWSVTSETAPCLRALRRLRPEPINSTPESPQKKTPHYSVWGTTLSRAAILWRFQAAPARSRRRHRKLPQRLLLIFSLVS